jgi:pimeloyl-ACP methyl ester carboxylesterase
VQHVHVKDSQIAIKQIKAKSGLAIPILFLHDSLGCISVWKDFPEKLVDLTGRSGIVYDRQGYGSSDPFSKRTRDNAYMEEEAGFLIRLMDCLNIPKAILFGHSDGGSIALIAAGKYPDRVEAVITEGAHVFVEAITIAGIRAAADLYQTTNLKSKLEKHHGDKTEAMFRAWTETWQTPKFRSWNIESFLPKITCPVLVIQGENDEYGSLLQVESIHSKCSGKKEKLLIAGIGHTPHKEAQLLTLEAAARFIGKLG